MGGPMASPTAPGQPDGRHILPKDRARRAALDPKASPPLLSPAPAPPDRGREVVGSVPWIPPARESDEIVEETAPLANERNPLMATTSRTQTGIRRLSAGAGTGARFADPHDRDMTGRQSGTGYRRHPAPGTAAGWWSLPH